MTKHKITSELSSQAHNSLTVYEQFIRTRQDYSSSTIRNYLGDVRLFMVWFEQINSDSIEHDIQFSPDQISTPTITRYRTYLQDNLGRKPATINRYLISIKRYFAWAEEEGAITYSPARVVKLVEQERPLPRIITDQQEAALIATVEQSGSLRDRTVIVLMLHTGLRIGEVCALQYKHIVIGERSGYLKIWGKRNKYREVPLNITVRKVLIEYLESLDDNYEYLFISQRTKGKLTTRALGYLVSKYARKARIDNLRPHDLRHRFGHRMAERTPLYRLAQIMGHDSLDTTMRYVMATQQDLQRDVEGIAWE